MLFDIDAAHGTWDSAIAGLTSSTAYDFSLDPNYGLVGVVGPLISAGSSVVSPGILDENVTIDRGDNGGTSPETLVGLGPSVGLGIMGLALGRFRK